MNSNSIIKKSIFSRKRLMASLFFLMALSVALRIASPLIFRNLINDVVIDNVIRSGKIVFVSVMLVSFSILIFLLDSQRINKSIVFGNDITMALSQGAYSTVIRAEVLDLSKIDNDDIIDKIVNKSNRIGNDYLGKNVIPFIYDGLLITSLLITLLVVNYWFFAFTLITMPLYYFITKQVEKLIDKRIIASKEANNDHEALLKENLKKVKNIKLLNGINAEEERYAKLIKKVERANRKEYNLSKINGGMINHLLADLILTGVIGIGAFLVISNNDNIHVGSIIASLLIIPQILPSMRRIMDLRVMPNHIEAERNELDEILGLKPENRADTVHQLDEIYSLKFKDVCFDYAQNSKFNLDNISFEIKKGEKLGILGLNSSGKTTITDLITKVIRPKQGSVLINNCDLNKVNSYYLRELISTVPQNFKLLNGTIEHNITYPLPFDEYKYNDALNKCHLKAVISTLDKKDKTIVSDDTDLLTLAEKQKVALANAFYKDAKIFVLDEVTSKVDNTTENELMSEIYKLKNKIILIISNRIFNLTNCDKILILNNGKIVEYGKTSELLDDSKSTFAKMMKEHEQSKSRVG